MLCENPCIMSPAKHDPSLKENERTSADQGQFDPLMDMGVALPNQLHATSGAALDGTDDLNPLPEWQGLQADHP